MSIILAVAGNIGAGKTTLAKQLASVLQCNLFDESVEDNPYLIDFYRDMTAWGSHLQFYFLGHRAEQLRRANDCTSTVVLDRTIYEDGEIFAPALAEFGVISQRDYRTYRRLYEAVCAQARAPDVLVYLSASVETLIKRIHQRGRPYEQEITGTYLSRLNERYDRWIRSFSACPVIHVETDDLDISDIAVVEAIVANARSIFKAAPDRANFGAAGVSGADPPL
jgi:deoxyadenosine/deoxycytidine kinase